MFMKISKFAAPVAGAVLLASAGLASSSASAAPLGGDLNAKSAQSALVIKAGHKNHGGHRGGGRHGGGFHKGHGKHFQAFGPREIRRSLRHRGYHRIQIVDRRGPMYIVNARGWRNAPMRLVVDSRNARIVRTHPIGNQFHWQFNF